MATGTMFWLLLLFHGGITLAEDITTKGDVTTTIVPLLSGNQTSSEANQTSSTTLLENCCILPDLLNIPHREDCANLTGLNVNDTETTNNNDCFIKCLMDTNKILNAGNIDIGTLAQTLRGSWSTEFEDTWLRILNSAINICTNTMTPTPVTTTPLQDIGKNCTFGHSLLFGCLYYELSTSCPLYAVNTTDPSCVNLRTIAITNVTMTP